MWIDLNIADVSTITEGLGLHNVWLKHFMVKK